MEIRKAFLSCRCLRPLNGERLFQRVLFLFLFYRFVKLRRCKLLQSNDHPHLPELPGDEVSCAQALNLAHSREKQKKGSNLRNVPFFRETACSFFTCGFSAPKTRSLAAAGPTSGKNPTQTPRHSPPSPSSVALPACKSANRILAVFLLSFFGNVCMATKSNL